MLFHVGVSGGKDSAAALLYLVHEAGVPKDSIVASFCDTGNEHQWTYEHVKLLSETVHPITTIKASMDFYTLALNRKRFPSSQVRFCTEELKIFPTQDHLIELRKVHIGRELVAVSGVRANESKDRAQLPEWDYSGTLLVKSWRPLLKWTLDDVVAIHKRHGVPLNPLYDVGARRVGCWPCVMSIKSEIRTIALKFPDRINAIRKAENLFESTYGYFSSFFASDKVPPRFRTKSCVLKDGRTILVASIDDVVRWSLTGKRAKGTWEDNPEEEPVCNSGFCE